MGVEWDFMGIYGIYPLVMTSIASEHDQLYRIFPSKIVIFHSYVKLPDGKTTASPNIIHWLNHWLVIEPNPLKDMMYPIGMMTYPIDGKIKVIFQTTDQVIYHQCCAN